MKRLSLTFTLLMLLALQANAAEYAKTYSWNTGDNWIPENLPVIVRIYYNNEIVGAAYDNLDTETSTTHTVNFDVQSIDRIAVVSDAEFAQGPTWEATTAYAVDDIVVASSVVNDGYIYFTCTRAGTSGAVEPTWPTVVGATIDDPDVSGVEWTVNSTAISQWQAEHVYAEGDSVNPSQGIDAISSVYICTTAGTSGATEPDWSAEVIIPWWAFWRRWISGTVGSYVQDGTAVWQIGFSDTTSLPSDVVYSTVDPVRGFQRKGRSMN